MPIPVEQSHSQGQHDRLFVGVARGGGRALLGVNGVGLRTGVIAGGHLKLWGACLLIPATGHTPASMFAESENVSRPLFLSCAAGPCLRIDVALKMYGDLQLLRVYCNNMTALCNQLRLACNLAADTCKWSISEV